MKAHFLLCVNIFLTNIVVQSDTVVERDTFLNHKSEACCIYSRSFIYKVLFKFFFFVGYWSTECMNKISYFIML